MLNKSGISKVTMVAPTQILADVDLQYSVGCVVPKTIGVAVGSKTIAKAGTPLNVDFANLQTAAKLGDGTNAMNAMLLHDVDVTGGNANGTALVFGFVNKNRIDTVTQGKIDTAVANDAASKLITVVKL